MTNFIAAEEKTDDLDFELLGNIFPEKVRSYLEEWKKENDKLLYLTYNGWKVHKARNIENIGEVSRIFINNAGTVLVGIDELYFKELVVMMKLKERYKVSLYKRINYAIAKKEGLYAVWHLKYINDILEQMENLELYAYDIEYNMTDKGLLVVRCSYYWALVAPIKIELEKVVLQERNQLRNMLEVLDEYIPEGIENKIKLTFLRLRHQNSNIYAKKYCVN